MSTMLLLCEMGVSGLFRGTIEQSGVTNLVSDSYRANKRRFLVATLGMMVLESARFFSYEEIFFALSGATSKRYRGIPRLSRRPSHWGYYAEHCQTRLGCGGCGVVYQAARLLEFLGFDCVEDFLQLVLFAPIFSVFELLEGVLGDKATCAQIAAVSSQRPPSRHKLQVVGTYSSVSSSWLASVSAVAGVQ